MEYEPKELGGAFPLQGQKVINGHGMLNGRTWRDCLVAVTVLFLAAAFIGAILAGFLGALFGGGMIIVPFLTAFLGIPIHQAIAMRTAY